MAKKTSRSASKQTVQETPKPVAPVKAGLQDHHKAFSHTMYGLFLLAIAFAAYYTFNALGKLSEYQNAEYFYPIVAIMLLLWAFLFWEFGHRVHTS